MLGHVVLQKFLVKNIFDIYDVTRKKENRKNNFSCNVTNFDSLAKIINEIKPNYIINCIGVLIKGSIQDPSNAILINAILPHKLAQFSKTVNAKLINISTDCVFSGKSGNYSENSVKDATDIYGK